MPKAIRPTSEMFPAIVAPNRGARRPVGRADALSALRYSCSGHAAPDKAR